MVATTTLLNKVGAELAKDAAVHAITDVTGFGLLGHSLEMARGSKLTVVLRPADLPLLTQATTLVQQGFVTGASIRNWASYGAEVKLPAGLPEWQRHLLTDPQTSGGLLVACAPDRANAILQTVTAGGYPMARIIGRVEQGAPEVRVEAS
jgi:selenide,water dikinase